MLAPGLWGSLRHRSLGLGLGTNCSGQGAFVRKRQPAEPGWAADSVVLSIFVGLL